MRYQTGQAEQNGSQLDRSTELHWIPFNCARKGGSSAKCYPGKKSVRLSQPWEHFLHTLVKVLNAESLSLSLSLKHTVPSLNFFFFKIKVVQLFQHSHASTFSKFVLVKKNCIQINEDGWIWSVRLALLQEIVIILQSGFYSLWIMCGYNYAN